MRCARRCAGTRGVFLLGEDVGKYGGAFGVTRGMLEEFGEERVRDTPISEAAITGCAVGAAMTGMRPIVEIMFSDFITIAMDQLVNQAAKARYQFGGQASIPMVLRTPEGSGTGAAAQHSQSVEAWILNVPGLKVVAPSTPADAKGLLKIFHPGRQPGGLPRAEAALQKEGAGAGRRARHSPREGGREAARGRT